MKLISVKLEKKAEKAYTESSALADAPAYPYGLEVRLDTETIEKLGLTKDLPEVGATLKLEALVDVTSVSENDRKGGGKSCSVSLQITEMGLKASGEKDASETLYDKGKAKK